MVDAAKSKKALDQTEYKGAGFWKPKGGPDFVDNFVRIIENPHLEGRLFLPVSLHWPPKGASWDAFLCPREMFQKTCPVHEAGFAELRRLKSMMPEKQAKDACRHYWSSWTQYVTVVVCNADGTPADDQPKMLSANKTLAGYLVDLLYETDGCPGCNEDGEHLPNCKEPDDQNRRELDYTDLETGFLVNIRTKEWTDGGFLKHDYVVKKARKPTPFDYPDILAQVPDPRELNKIMEHDEILSLLTPGEETNQLLLLAGPGPEAPDPLAPKGEEAPTAEEDLWGNGASEQTAEPEAETTAEPAPEEEAPKKKPAAKKKAKKDSAEDIEAKRQNLRDLVQN